MKHQDQVFYSFKGCLCSVSCLEIWRNQNYRTEFISPCLREKLLLYYQLRAYNAFQARTCLGPWEARWGTAGSSREGKWLMLHRAPPLMGHLALILRCHVPTAVLCWMMPLDWSSSCSSLWYARLRAAGFSEPSSVNWFPTLFIPHCSTAVLKKASKSLFPCFYPEIPSGQLLALLYW